MTRARKTLVSLDETPYYHCVSRCVRRAFLWGRDRHSGRDYSHRKQWVIDRLALLTEVFAIDLCAYAVMSNHYHLVVRIDADRAAAWSEEEVIDRWAKLFGLPLLVARHRAGHALSAPERQAVAGAVATWRARLYDLSWFMRCLNEDLARRANAEDKCRGRFWEGRFKCQALLDEAGLLTCMAYVDLNPIRAGVATTPEASGFTSIAERIRRFAQGVSSTQAAGNTAGPDGAEGLRLVPFRDATPDACTALPYGLEDYLALVDWTGRAIRDDKRGHIPNDLPPILVRLQINPRRWLRHMRPQGNRFGRAIGRIDALRAHAEECGQRWIQGLAFSGALFGRAG